MALILHSLENLFDFLKTLKCTLILHILIKSYTSTLYLTSVENHSVLGHLTTKWNLPNANIKKLKLLVTRDIRMRQRLSYLTDNNHRQTIIYLSHIQWVKAPTARFKYHWMKRWYFKEPPTYWLYSSKWKPFQNKMKTCIL